MSDKPQGSEMTQAEFRVVLERLAAALAELANVKDDFDTAIAQRDKATNDALEGAAVVFKKTKSGYAVKLNGAGGGGGK